MALALYLSPEKPIKKVSAKLFESGQLVEVMELDNFKKDDRLNFALRMLPRRYQLEVTATGYQKTTVNLGDIFTDQEYVSSDFIAKILPLKKDVTTLLIAIAALTTFAVKKKKEVGKVTFGDVLPFALIAGGILSFDLIKRLLENLGIWDSKDTKDLDNDSTNPGSFWNPNFWRNAPNGSYSYAITSQTAMAWAKELYNAFGPFNDCEECAIAVFKRCRTQANASFLCDYFQRIYGQDCLTFLRGGIWPQDRLSDADVNTISNYIKNLPKY